MAGKPLFASDEDILAALKKRQGLAWIACNLNTSLQRVRSIRDRFKTEITIYRITEHKQSIDSICYQLDLLNQLDRMRIWYTNTYGDTHGQH